MKLNYAPFNLPFTPNLHKDIGDFSEFRYQRIG